MVGQAADFLLLDLKTYLRPTQHDLDVRPQRLQQPHHLRGFDHVPDVEAQADNLGVERQQFFNHLRRLLLNHKFTQHRLRPQPGAAMQIHIRQQAAQAERGVDVFGVQGGQNDGRGTRNFRSGHDRIIEAGAHEPKPPPADAGTA